MAETDSNRKCGVLGCTNPLRARGMCATHWSRWKRHGDPTLGERHKLERTCTVGWCARKPRARFHKSGDGYCAMHYLQVFKHGQILPKSVDSDPNRQCSIDGCDSMARSPKAAWCEMHYSRNRKKGSPLADVRDAGPFDSCHYCGKASGGRMYCSGRCSTRSARDCPRFRQCDVCQRTYEPVNDRRCCSPECKRIQRQQYQDVRRMTTSLTSEGKRARFVVLERDGWVCQLCGEPTDRKVRWPHPMYPTIDHIIPVSKGGKHEEINLQCAHAQCNIRKQATMPDLYALKIA